jgi:hypothetical protein
MYNIMWLRNAAVIAVFLFLTGITMAQSTSPSGSPTLFYVATNGSDAWSGTLPTPNRNKTDGPFATIGRAQSAVRQVKSVAKGPITVTIRGGFYPLAEPLTFTADDSGTPQAPIIYKALPGPEPVLSGGLRIDGWKETEKGVWQTQLPEVVQGQWYFSQLYVNGERRYRPRLPKSGYYEVAGEVEPTADAQNQGDNRFRFKPGEIKSDWYDLNAVEVLPFQIWTASRFRIASVEEGESIATLSGHTINREAYQGIRKGRRFLVENVREALTDPGEWYLDRRTGVLTYLAKPGERPDKMMIVAPRLEKFLLMDQTQYVRFEGLNFSYTSWSVPPQGYSFAQAEVIIPASVEITNGNNITFDHCTIAHTGNWAVALRQATRSCTLDHCELTDLGAGGVKIGEMEYRDDPLQLAHGNVVTDCMITHGGRLHPAAIGVWIGQSPYNKLLHNEIADFYYTAISPGWTWGYGPSGTHHNEIAYNHIHDIGQGVLSDMGGIYTLGISPGTVLHHNKIHDITSFDYGGWGIYFDEGSTGIVAEDNLVYRTKSAPFHQHYGKENIVRNNIFAFGREAQLMRTRAEDHLSFTMSHNIILWSEGPLLGSNWSGNEFKLADNLYWHEGKPVLFPGRLTLADWQAKGFDSGSVVADPDFAAPERDDFTLRADSPAPRIGFVPFDLSTVGPRGQHPQYRAVPAAFPLTYIAPNPPRLVQEDFESSAVGAKPDGFGVVLNEETAVPAATIRVTDETAHSGKHSLKFTDAPGQQFSYNPHLFYQPHFTEGIATGKFAIRWEAGAQFYHEWRDNQAPYRVGPSLNIAADGMLSANGKPLTALPKSRWIEFEIVCGLGNKATGTYDLTVRLPGRVPPMVFKALPCGSGKDFDRLDWWGFVSNATETTVFYLDDLSLTIK